MPAGWVAASKAASAPVPGGASRRYGTPADPGRPTGGRGDRRCIGGTGRGRPGFPVTLEPTARCVAEAVGQGYFAAGREFGSSESSRLWSRCNKSSRAAYQALVGSAAIKQAVPG